MTQILEVANFSGGMTDNYIDGPPNKFQKADNFFINIKGKPYVRPGSAEYDAGYAAIFPDSSRIDALPYSKDQGQLYAKIAKKLYSKVSGTWQAVNDYSAASAFGQASDTDKISWAEWNKHLYVTSQSLGDYPAKTYKDNGGTQRLVTTGLPAGPTFTASSAGGTGNSYVYAVVWYRSYTVGTVSFEDYGAPHLYQITNVGAPNVNNITLTTVNTYTNGTGEHFNTAAMQAKVYRTVSGGTTLLYVGTYTLGGTFVDSSSDATILNNNITLYTEGGVLDNDLPPKAKYLAVANDIMFYGHVKSGSEVLTNIVKHSKPADPDSVPGSFEVEVKEEITGLGSTGKNCIVFCKSRIYRLDGFVDEFGRGTFEAVEIDSTIGCVSHNSIVHIARGLLFAGTNGFYFTDGYRVVRISTEFDDTYATLVSTATKRANIIGASDDIGQRVWWAVQQDDSNTDNDSCFVLDLTFGITPASVFTTVSGGDHFWPTALAFDGSNMVRASGAGICALLKHDESYLTDYDVASNAEATIVYEYRSCAYALGSTSVRKWVTKILASFQTTTDVSLQIYSNNNDGQKVRPLQEIRMRDNITWGDPAIVWGDTTVTWGFGGTASRIRRFPAGDLRTTYKQIILTNSYTNVAASDDYGTATVTAYNATTKAVQIPIDFPTNSVGYFISFADDNYQEEYEVILHSGDTIHVTDTSSHLIEGTGKSWLLKGFQKGEHLQLMSYVLYYEVFGPSHRSYHGAAKEDGGNA